MGFNVSIVLNPRLPQWPLETCFRNTRENQGKNVKSDPQKLYRGDCGGQKGVPNNST